MRGGFSGQWWTTGGSSGGLVLLIIGALLLLGSGAAAAITTAVLAVLIAVAAVVVMAVAGLTAWLVCRARRGQPVIRPPVIITSPDRAPLPPPAPRGIEPPAPREVHQHWHLHFDGADPQEAAAIVRQIRKEG